MVLMLLPTSFANASGKYQLVLVDYSHKKGQWKSQAIEFVSSKKHYLKSTMLMTKKVANNY